MFSSNSCASTHLMFGFPAQIRGQNASKLVALCGLDRQRYSMCKRNDSVHGLAFRWSQCYQWHISNSGDRRLRTVGMYSQVRETITAPELWLVRSLEIVWVPGSKHRAGGRRLTSRRLKCTEITPWKRIHWSWSPLEYTDDTEMASSVAEVLREGGC